MYLKDWLQRRHWKRRGVKISRGSSISQSTQIGGGTRINGRITIKGKGACFIGRYCAFGADVKVITSNHLTSYANLQCTLQRKIGAIETDVAFGSVTIGHNVWIGDSVIVLSGVSIGDGAVIGAGAVVTKNVPSYSIVGGVPAKVIRARFSEQVIQKLSAVEWWNWSPEELRRNREMFDFDLSRADALERLEALTQ
ncbi:MAG: CatB-related O-acetyltransferase [Opitutaceae bacterium]